MEYVVSQNNEMNDSTRSSLLGMCKTRWCERDVSNERFYLAIPYIMEALEVMNGMHADIINLTKHIRRGGAQKINKKLPRIYMHCPIPISSLV